MVLKYCSGSYLDDQDKIRLSGIFRDVYILERSIEGIRDFRLKKQNDGTVKLKVDAPKEAKVQLFKDNQMINSGMTSEGEITFTVKDPILWSAENPYLYELFGSDITTYTNGEENPYNINLDTYGSDVTVYFYEPNLSILTDPYASLNKSDFYENYEVATTYEDAYFRSKHFLMSGDITPQNYLPVEGKIEENSKVSDLRP